MLEELQIEVGGNEDRKHEELDKLKREIKKLQKENQNDFLKENNELKNQLEMMK